MRISPIQFGITGQSASAFKKPVAEKSASVFIPVTSRKNSLADMEFNIIADTIRCQNLKNQMNIRLMNLKKNLNGGLAKDLYS